MLSPRDFDLSTAMPHGAISPEMGKLSTPVPSMSARRINPVSLQYNFPPKLSTERPVGYFKPLLAFMMVSTSVPSKLDRCIRAAKPSAQYSLPNKASTKTP